MKSMHRPLILGSLLAAALAFSPWAQAQGPAPAKPAAKPAAKKPPPKKAAKPAPPPEFVPPIASPEQIEASQRVYYGLYDCEFQQTIDIVENAKYPAYVDVKYGKQVYVMKPVVSSTGAIRLEDILDQTLMVQIASKSMMLNVKSGQRMVDDCVSPKQREAIEQARAEAAARAAGAAPELGIAASQPH